MASVTLKSVSKSYNGVTAVKNLSLEIENGEFLALLGPPGAGKSSTLKMIAGVETVSDGEILFDGHPVHDLPPHKRDVALVFESYALYPHKTAFENIAYPLREHKSQMGLDDEGIKHRVREMAALLQITEQLEKLPAHLSGGQRQRVALARALVRNPRVFLMDEPIAHLDARLRHELRGELKRFQRKRGTTMIWATPDYLEAIAMANRVAVLFNGELHQLGTPGEILNAPATAKVAEFIGDPPMNIIPTTLVNRDDRVFLEYKDLQIPVPGHLKEALSSDKYAKGLLIGIRPGDVRISQSDPGGMAFPARLYVVERLHRKVILSIEKDDLLIKANTSADFQGRIGDTIWLEFPEDKLFVFDAATSLAVS